MAATVIDLLSEDARKARGIIKEFSPNLSIESYVAMQRARFTNEVYTGV